MSRKRDTNWSKDEITALLDSIKEITRTRAQEGKRTTSKEVFEYAAKKMGDKGHTSRAEREKCRTKWKKMKEEFTHAKKAREGDSRFKEAPGIQPFYDRMEEFINGSFDNISPHSTIVRRASSLLNKTPSGMRTSARIAANTNGTSPTDNNDTSSTIKTNTSTEYPSTIHSPSVASSSPRQNSRLSSVSSSNNNNSVGTNNTTTAAINNNNITAANNQANNNNHHQQQQATPNGEVCIYTAYNDIQNNNSSTTNTTSGNESANVQSTEHADISYRVSTGCRQITIFGDHDVDIKFRGDCVTINKIVVDFPATDT